MIVGRPLQLALDAVLAFSKEEDLLGYLGLVVAEVASVNKVPHVRRLHVILQHEAGLLCGNCRIALSVANGIYLILIFGLFQVVLEALDGVDDCDRLVLDCSYAAAP